MVPYYIQYAFPVDDMRDNNIYIQKMIALKLKK